jgi:hypothetical protein
MFWFLLLSVLGLTCASDEPIPGRVLTLTQENFLGLVEVSTLSFQ